MRLELRAEEVAEEEGAVVLGVAGGVEKRDVAAASGLEERLPGCGIGAKFREVAFAEFGPALDFVAVPDAELPARRDVFQPGFEMERFLFNAAGPEAFDEEARARWGFGKFVNASDFDHGLAYRT